MQIIIKSIQIDLAMFVTNANFVGSHVFVSWCRLVGLDLERIPLITCVFIFYLVSIFVQYLHNDTVYLEF